MGDGLGLGGGVQMRFTCDLLHKWDNGLGQWFRETPRTVWVFLERKPTCPFHLAFATKKVSRNSIKSSVYRIKLRLHL